MPENTVTPKPHKEPKTITTTPVDVEVDERTSTRLAEIVADNIGAVMLDRSNMSHLERALDQFMINYYKRTAEEKASLRSQMENAKLALESLTNRLLQQL